jgi:hypothetical protein
MPGGKSALLMLVLSVPAGCARRETDAQDGALRAVDLASELGLRRVGITYSVAPADADGDADTDLLFAGWHGEARLYAVTEAGGLRTAFDFPPQESLRRPDRHGCAWGDFDGDGRLDLACAAGRTEANYRKAPDVDNELWLARPDGTYREVGTDWGLGDPCGRGRAQLPIDADGDGWLDLYTTNETPRAEDSECSGRGPNRLFLNVADPRGGRRMASAPELGLDLDLGHGRCGRAFDWDGDGRQDLLLCAKDGLRLFANRAEAGFQDVTAEAGLAGVHAIDAALADLDADGDLDLAAAAWARIEVHLAAGRRFGPAGRAERFPGGGVQLVVPGDWDGDGRQDLYVLRGTAEPGNLNPDDAILLQGPPGSFRRRVAVPSAPGRGDHAARARLPGWRCDVAVVANGRAASKGPMQVIALEAPGCLPPGRQSR